MHEIYMVRPKMSGQTDYKSFFDYFLVNGKKVTLRVDEIFEKFLQTNEDSFTDRERAYVLFQTDERCSDIDIIKAFDITKKDYLTKSELYANIKYLADEGKKNLDIPVDEEGVTFILGYVEDGETGIVYALYIEHELKHDQNEIHLYAQPLRNWGTDKPSGFAKQKTKE